MAVSTSRARAAAAAGSARGLNRDGARGSPASTAACHSVTRRAETPKYIRAAASTPQVPEPRYTRFSQISRISRLLKLCSSHSVSSSSCTLRRNVRALVRNRFLATCWVMVEPPCASRPLVTLTQTARASADRIDAGMVPKTAILHRDRGRRQGRRHVVQPQRVADDVAEGGEHAAGAVLQCEARPARRIQRGFGPRQVAREPQHHDGERQHAPDRGNDGVAAAGGSAGVAARRRDAAVRARARRGGGARERGGGHVALGRG